MFGQIAITAVLAVAASAGPSLVQRASTPSPINLGIPSTLPANASGSLDPYLISFSIEPAFLDEFLGNKSNPNALTLQLISNIEKVTGGIALRPGGATVDASIYDPSLVGNEVRTLSPAGAVWRTTWGPSFLESLNLLPASSKIIMDVNLLNNSYEIASNQASAAVQALGSKLDAIEIGNEPDVFTLQGYKDPSEWNISTYTQTFVDWSRNMTTGLNLPKNFFQAGGFATDPTGNFTVANSIALGVNNASTVKYYCEHMYNFGSCTPAMIAAAKFDNVVNHQNITTFMNKYVPQIAAAKTAGAPFVVGEFNSVGCSGMQNVSNTFGQTLWLADTFLYGATLNITRMFAHQGATLVAQSTDQINTPGFSWYNFVYPSDSARNGPARATPSYPGLLLVAEAMGTSAKTSNIAYFPVAAHPQLAAYVVWDSSARSGAPARVVLLNLGAETGLSVNLSSLSPSGVKRLHSPTRDNSDSDTVTWGGQSWTKGTASGSLVIEKPLSDGSVAIGAYEAVLVYLAGVNGTATATPVGTASTSGSSSTSTSTKSGALGRSLSLTAGGVSVAFVAALHIL
ncbi:glycoside hydrolase family 79 protein [Laccaria bicolor S238N-H82]|uniref:Glycoside hydrolase family 79 protein n=1 Tax=Laccaria bicolor (strain S238N-H82 / ATCC MYA-4686) TaxID=486041 RepID=B0DQI9_LACBS|nr:glycoside hydrolase family 79 protein [Laccaria bicolor S238N-H82]EDR03121.1 glycoside hydrolase family 79 protein [Laccaria bicolor S238N-H82]|eukprot:XP_001886262.1 glycoside hydrolase family 79 protein [Laccaria bicolor S238N-H82]